MSILLLLLVGVNMNVRASVASGELVQKSTDKEQSDKESQQEPKETITELDFFGAFSLVNIQLQWRDLHGGLNDEVTDVESENPKELTLEEVETLSLEVKERFVPVSPIINNGEAVIPVSAYPTVCDNTHSICSENKQSARTIAYILNCGTYPLSF